MSKATSTIEPVEPDRLYSYEEVAAIFDATARQVRRWVEEGKLGYVTKPSGRGRLVPGRVILDHIEHHTVAAEV